MKKKTNIKNALKTTKSLKIQGKLKNITHKKRKETQAQQKHEKTNKNNNKYV